MRRSYSEHAKIGGVHNWTPRSYFIDPHDDHFVAGYYTSEIDHSIAYKRVYTDDDGPILFKRWIDAYDWLVNEKLSGNYALAQLVIQ